MKCSRCGREITVTEPGATGWEALGDGREVTCEACITLEEQGQIDATIIDITAGTDTEALFEPIRQEQADLAAVLEPGEPPLADRVRAAKAIKAGRDAARIEREAPLYIRLAPVPHDLSDLLKISLHLIGNPRSAGVFCFVVPQ